MKITIDPNNLRFPDRFATLKTTLLCLAVIALFSPATKTQAETATNPPLIAVNDVLQRNQDSRLRVRIATLLINDLKPGNDRLAFSSFSPTSAAGGTITRRGKWISYTPPAGFTNSDSFSYVITNSSGLTSTGLVFITIRTDLDPSQNVGVWERLAEGKSLIQFFGIPGRTYTIEYTENLETPRWRPVGKRAPDATGRFEWIETPTQAGRIYRSTCP